MKLSVIPFSDVDPVTVRQLMSDLTFLAIELYANASIELPKQAYNATRQQYRANALLDQVRHNEGEHLLGVTNADMYVEGLNFVFGLAELPGRASIISLYRLHFDASDTKFRERAAKEAVHEFGHSLGLPHCPNPRCVMHFSNSLQDTDIKSKEFCTRCKTKLSGLINLLPERH